jgi:hypothetical protein
MFKNVVLRKICGPKKDEVPVGWRNCKIRSFMKCSPHQILFRTHVGQMREKTNACIVLVEKPEGNRTLQRLRHR